IDAHRHDWAVRHADDIERKRQAVEGLIEQLSVACDQLAVELMVRDMFDLWDARGGGYTSLACFRVTPGTALVPRQPRSRHLQVDQASVLDAARELVEASTRPVQPTRAAGW